LVESLPADYLALIPEILSEAVLGTKEVNEKARDAGFDLLVAMGHKMAKGGTVTRMTAGPGDGEDEDEDAVGQEGMSSLLAGSEGIKLTDRNGPGERRGVCYHGSCWSYCRHSSYDQCKYQRAVETAL
jgi:hypothetical protein